MPVLLVSANVDFAPLVAFLLRHHGVPVVLADAATAVGRALKAAATQLLIVDCSDPETFDRLGATAVEWAADDLILLVPPELLAEAHGLAPDATAYVELPLRPSAFVTFLTWALARTSQRG